MPTWPELHKLIDERATDSVSWASNQRDLHFIFNKAEEWGIDAADLKKASLSNMRTIITSAKSAIKNNNRNRLIEIFMLASTVSAVELRIQLGISDRKQVKVEKYEMDGEERYSIVHLTFEQLERVVRATRSSFDFDLTALDRDIEL
jgi:hypothetical protein